MKPVKASLHGARAPLHAPKVRFIARSAASSTTFPRSALTYEVYRGTGKVLMTPTVPGTLMEGGEVPNKESEGGSAAKGILSGIAKLATD